MEYRLSLPLTVEMSRMKYRLNLNVYQRTNHYLLNSVKKKFYDEITPQLLDIPQLEKVELHYTYYPKTYRRCDVMNVGTVVDKFLCDSLVWANILRDDCYEVIPYITFNFGGVDKENPRVEVVIKEIE